MQPCQVIFLKHCVVLQNLCQIQAAAGNIGLLILSLRLLTLVVLLASASLPPHRWFGSCDWSGLAYVSTCMCVYTCVYIYVQAQYMYIHIYMSRTCKPNLVLCMFHMLRFLTALHRVPSVGLCPSSVGKSHDYLDARAPAATGDALLFECCCRGSQGFRSAGSPFAGPAICIYT